MCGIYGLIVTEESGLSQEVIYSLLRDVAVLSGYRGYDSSGAIIALDSEEKYLVYKGNLSVKELYKQPKFVEKIKLQIKNSSAFRAIGHARLATNGSQLSQENNQPMLSCGLLLVHNGIITNHQKLWQEFSGELRKSKLDTEVIPTVFSQLYKKHAKIAPALKEFYNKIEGTAAIATCFEHSSDILLASNFGSLFVAHAAGVVLFASERYFLESISKKHQQIWQITEVKAGDFAVISARANVLFAQYRNDSSATLAADIRNNTVDLTAISAPDFKDAVLDPEEFQEKIGSTSNFSKLVELPHERIAKLKRCTKCILPETFPHIIFDVNGVCNYCNNYVTKFGHQSKERLKALLDKYRDSTGEVKCIVPFSGGRDSTYLIHILVTEFDVKPITYTYDWGMVTDLARRNIARVCGKLGLENIIVSADIREKRKFIRANVLAWLKNPQLGMIPLFMSGDKAFYYYLEKVKEHTHISFNLWGENFLEKTDFKVGFAGVKPEFKKSKIYSLSKGSMFTLMKYLLLQVIKNPAYINASLWDNLKAQYSRTFLKKTDYYNFYDFYPWDETEVESAITTAYAWEKAIDTDSTWRIGDGTSSFYNYIYYTVAGFSEFDTFRSNQIREGAISREQALKYISADNEVRFATLRWYLEILGLDFKEVITRVNNIPKLYP